MPLAQPALWAAMLVAGCAGLSALLILALKPLLVRFLLARPNARSSHTIATPQGAGLAVMVSVLAGCALGLLLWAQSLAPASSPSLPLLSRSPFSARSTTRIRCPCRGA